MFNYCFIRVSDYMLVFVVVFVSSFGRDSVGTVKAMFVPRSLIMCHFSLTF